MTKFDATFAATEVVFGGSAAERHVEQAFCELEELEEYGILAPYHLNTMNRDWVKCGSLDSNGRVCTSFVRWTVVPLNMGG